MHPDPKLDAASSAVKLIDTHCHLDFTAFDASRDTLLENSTQQGILHVIIPATRAQSWPVLQDLSQRYPCVSYAVGLHPWFLSSFDNIHPLRTWLEDGRQPECVALGETGLDGRCSTDWALQERVFIHHLELAEHYHKPLILHSVGTHDAITAHLKRYTLAQGGVVHGFSGSFEQGMAFWKLGFRIGVGPIIENTHATKTRRAITRLPLEALLLETDAPNKKQPCAQWPAQLQRVFSCLCQLRHEDKECVANTLVKNAKDTFFRAHS